MGEKGLIGTTIKDTWTKTRRGGDRGGMGGKGRKLYLNNNKIQKYLKKILFLLQRHLLFIKGDTKLYIKKKSITAIIAIITTKDTETVKGTQWCQRNLGSNPDSDNIFAQ